jgi:hypothetical protein
LTLRYHQPLLGVWRYTYRSWVPLRLFNAVDGTVAEKPLLAKPPPKESAMSGRGSPTVPSTSFVPPESRAPS